MFVATAEVPFIIIILPFPSSNSPFLPVAIEVVVVVVLEVVDAD